MKNSDKLQGRKMWLACRIEKRKKAKSGTYKFGYDRRQDRNKNNVGSSSS